MNNTQNLADFGHIERDEAAKLLSALGTSKDKTKYFGNEGVAVEFNPMSGYVFLVDEEFNVAMLYGGDLYDFHTCPNCGGEGIALEFRDENEADCCQEYADELELA